MESKTNLRHKPIPEGKSKLVNDLASRLGKSRTILVASCKSLPSSQFQAIRKSLRGKADIKFMKKTALTRAIDKTGKGALQNLKEGLQSDFAVFFSDIDAFELSALLTDSEVPTKAKPGDIAPEDIEIEPGPTDLVPGPAISELGSVGLKVAVKEGKLEIQKGAVVVRAGETISEKVASVLGKLGVSPLKVGFIPLAAYDGKDDKVYLGIKIDKAGTLEELRTLIGKAMGFAVGVSFPTKETIKFLIGKAAIQEKAFNKLISGDKKEESNDQTQQDTKEEAN